MVVEVILIGETETLVDINKINPSFKEGFFIILDIYIYL